MKLIRIFSVLTLVSASGLLADQQFFTEEMLAEIENASSLEKSGWKIAPVNNTDTYGLEVLDSNSRIPSPLPGKSVRIYDLSEDQNVFVEKELEVSGTGLVYITMNAARHGTEGEGFNASIRFRVGNAAKPLTSSKSSPLELLFRSDGSLTIIYGGKGKYSTLPGIFRSPAKISLVVNNSKEAKTVSEGSGAPTLNGRAFAVFVNDQPVLDMPEGGFPFSTEASDFEPDHGIQRIGFVSASTASGGDYAFANLSVTEKN